MTSTAAPDKRSQGTGSLAPSRSEKAGAAGMSEQGRALPPWHLCWSPPNVCPGYGGCHVCASLASSHMESHNGDGTDLGLVTDLLVLGFPHVKCLMLGGFGGRSRGLSLGL